MTPPLRTSHSDFAIVVRDVGRLLPLVGAMAVASLFVPLLFGESYAIAPLLITAAVSLALGAALYFPLRCAGETQLRHAMVTAAVAWILVPALGSLPFLLVALMTDAGPEAAAGLSVFRDPANAFFESVSGFTTTGLTLSPRPDLLCHTLQWWRSLSQWIGGLGILVTALSVLSGPRPGATLYSMYYAEARTEKIRPTVRATVRTMWWIFFLFTGVSLVLQWRLGAPIWQAANHAMTAMATGGFTITAPGARLFPNTWSMVVLLGTMLAGAISFSVHYETLGSGWRKFLSDYQTRALLVFVACGAALLALENLSSLGAVEALRTSAFHFVSAATTTGFQTADIVRWSDTAKLILALGMFVGGAAGSTAGGFKILRLVVLLKGVQWRFRQILSPRQAVVPFRIGRTALDDDEAGTRLEDAALIFFLWSAFLGVGVVVLLHTVPSHFSLGDVVLEVASAQGNTGLTTGITAASLPLAAKLALAFNMWVGRLEIIPVLMLVRSFLGRGA